MTYAVRIGDFITNMIVAQENQKEELEAALNAELINTAEYNLSMGDYWNGEAWTRNVNGEQVVVDTTPVHEPTAEERITALENAIAEGVALYEEDING